MLSRLLPFARLSLAVIAVTVLSGCSANRYLMVEKRDLNTLNSTVSAQQAAIEDLDRQARKRQQTLLSQDKASTQRILEAITHQVEKPSCPPVQKQTACPSITRHQAEQIRRLEGKIIVGQVEKFYLEGPGVTYDARIDSGAETSSLDARNITRFERDGSNWVRFEIPVPGKEEMVSLEREVSRRVRILQSATEESERRVVVELQFSLGNHQQQAEFTLTNRSHLSHRVLVGRNILRDVMLIDVGKEFTTELTAQEQGEEQKP